MATQSEYITRLNALCQLADKHASVLPERMTVLDHLLFGIAQEDTELTLALAGYKNLLGAFHNFNEIRVSLPTELAGLLEGIPDAGSKARRMLEVLQFTFETTYSFDLESMRKKPVRQVQKQLSKIPGTTAFAVNATLQRALDGRIVPLDKSSREILVRLGIVDERESTETIASFLESTVPKDSVKTFSNFLGELVGDSRKLNKVIKELGESSSSKEKSKSPVKPKSAKKAKSK